MQWEVRMDGWKKETSTTTTQTLTYPFVPPPLLAGRRTVQRKETVATKSPRNRITERGSEENTSSSQIL